MASTPMLKQNIKTYHSLTSVIVSLILSTQPHLLCHEMSTGWWRHWCILSLWKTWTIGTTQSINI